MQQKLEEHPVFAEALRLHQASKSTEAEPIYRRLIAEWPDAAAPLHMLGVIHLQRGEFDDALVLIGQALRIDTKKAVYWNNFGAVLTGLERHVEALACYLQSVAIRPEYADGLSNVGMAYENIGQLELAAEYFRKALDVAPKHRDARARYASLVERSGDAAGALRLCEEELSEQPSAEVHVRMGSLLLFTGRAQEAIEQYETALRLDPKSTMALFNLGNAYQEQQRIDLAREKFAAAAELKPRHSLWRLRPSVICPPVFRTNQEIDDFCGELSASLDQWIDSPPPAKAQQLVTLGLLPNLSYAYLGRNVRGLKEKFSQFHAHYFRDLPTPTGSALKGKCRLGIVVTHRHEGIFLRCMTGILRGLSRDLFELVVLCSHSSVKPIRDMVQIPHLRFMSFGNSLDEAVRTLHQAKCDVLYYWECGSDALNWFLPFCRLAPVQCTSHGSQITTGNPAIGHFYSSRLMECELAQEHYTEKLWNSNTLLIDQSRLPQLAAATWSNSPLPADRTLYMCLQNPLKIHPDFDPLLRGILERDPRGVVVLLGGAYPFMEQQLRERFKTTMPGLDQRILFLPYQQFPAYCQLLNMADVVLDPPHFGHGSSAYDVFSYNLPLVTMRTKLNVGRVGAACYQKMELPQLVAGSPEGYIELAARLGTDRNYREFFMGQIKEASSRLFDDHQATAQHQRFFTEVAGY